MADRLGGLIALAIVAGAFSLIPLYSAIWWILIGPFVVGALLTAYGIVRLDA
jgi:hypothetical protein